MERYEVKKRKLLKMLNKGKAKKPIISLLIAIGLMIPITVSGFISVPLDNVFGNTSSNEIFYTDINRNHWAFDPITEMTKAEIIVGYPNGCFRPKELITCAEFIKMATVASGAVKGKPERKAFEHWANPYYEAGLNMRYYSEYDVGEKSLDQPIHRGHMALIVSSILGEIKVPDYGGFLEQIRDINSRTPYEYEIVCAYATGILTGYPDKTFRPDKPLTRAEAAAVISRLIEKLENKSEVKIPEKVKKKELVVIGSVDSSEPEGTLTFTISNYGVNLDEQHKQLFDALNEHRPNEAEDIYNAVIEFGRKPLGATNQGINQQYFNDYPVLIDHVADVVRIYIYPIGSMSEYWEILSGEINEEFF